MWYCELPTMFFHEHRIPGLMMALYNVLKEKKTPLKSSKSFIEDKHKKLLLNPPSPQNYIFRVSDLSRNDVEISFNPFTARLINKGLCQWFFNCLASHAPVVLVADGAWLSFMWYLNMKLSCWFKLQCTCSMKLLCLAGKGLNNYLLCYDNIYNVNIFKYMQL